MCRGFESLLRYQKFNKINVLMNSVLCEARSAAVPVKAKCASLMRWFSVPLPDTPLSQDIYKTSNLENHYLMNDVRVSLFAEMTGKCVLPP